MEFKQLTKIRKALEKKPENLLTADEKELLEELKELEKLNFSKLKESLSMGGNICPTCKRPY